MPRPDPVKAEEQLVLCLSDMEAASSRPFARGVNQFVKDQAMEIFLKNQPKWTPEAGVRVRRAATFAGKIAALCAEFDGKAKVTRRHAGLAIGVVKDLGNAVPSNECRWCPDFKDL